MRKSLIGIAIVSLLCIGICAVYIKKDISFDEAYRFEVVNRFVLTIYPFSLVQFNFCASTYSDPGLYSLPCLSKSNPY